MKTIDDIIKRIQPEKQKELASFLNTKSVSEAKLKESLLNIFTLNRLISSLDRNELKIFRLLYTSTDGLSFGDIQKLTDITIDEKILMETVNLVDLDRKLTEYGY